MNNNTDDGVPFIECLYPSSNDHRPDDDDAFVDAYVLTLMNPKECSSFIKHLSTVLPLSSSLSHLKRVHRTTINTTTNSDTARKNDIEEFNDPQEEERKITKDLSTSTTKDNDVVDCYSLQKRSCHDMMSVVSSSSSSPQPITNCGTFLNTDNINNSSTSTRPSSTILTKRLKVLLGTKMEIEQRFGSHLLLPKRLSSSTTTKLASATTTNHHYTFPVLLSNKNGNQELQTKHDSCNDFISIVLQPLENPIEVYSTLEMIKVPKYPPRSEQEWKFFNNTIWSTTYIPNQMVENVLVQKGKELQLSAFETESMITGIKAAILDSNNFNAIPGYRDRCGGGGVVIVCPQTNQIVSTAYDEYQCIHEHQCQPTSSMQNNNPLLTPYIYAIRGISRIERRNTKHISSVARQVDDEIDRKDDSDENHLSRDTINDGLKTPQPSHHSEQYLCTGYDVYATVEPTIYEAMALVHSRIRRLIFGCIISDVIRKVKRRNDVISNTTTTLSPDTIHIDSGIVETHVHALPSTNHHFRAFMCAPNSELWQQCFSSVCGASNVSYNYNTSTDTDE